MGRKGFEYCYGIQDVMLAFQFSPSPSLFAKKNECVTCLPYFIQRRVIVSHFISHQGLLKASLIIYFYVQWLALRHVRPCLPQLSRSTVEVGEGMKMR